MRRFSLPELRRLGPERWAVGGTPVLAQLPMIPTFQEVRPALDGELRRSRRYERPLAVLVVVPDVEPISSANGNGSRAHRGNGAHGRNGTHGGNGTDGTNGTHAGNGAHGGNGAHVAGSHNGNGASGDREIAEAAVQPLYWAQLRFLLLGSLVSGTLRESDIVSYAPAVHEYVALLPECGGIAARQAAERLQQVYASRTGIGLRAGTAVYPADGLTLDDLLAHARGAITTVDALRALANTNGNGAAHA